MALTNPIILQVDQQSGVFQLVGTGALPAWPALFQGSVRDLQIGVVQSTGNPNTPFIQINEVGYTMVITVSATPQGNGTQRVYAGPTVLTWSAGLNAFIGSLDLTGANITTDMAANEALAVTIELELVLAGVHQPLYQQDQIQIKAPANPGGAGTPPGPGISFYTTAETNSGFVPQNGTAPGQGRIETSAGGTRVFIFTQDDGSEGRQILH